MKLKDISVYVRSMNKALRVVAWFPSGSIGEEQANAYMAKNQDTAVVSDCDGMILLANVHDKGEKIGT